MTDITAPGNGLTPSETRHLGALEKRIERGLQTFREVGEALLEIRDQRLFRATHPSFEAYISGRWGMERQRAYQLMGASEVVQTLGEAGSAIVNEAQARELVPLLHSDPGAMEKAIEEAQKAGPLTAPSLRKAVLAVSGAPAGPEAPRPTNVVSLLARIRGLEASLTTFAESEVPKEDRDRVREALQRLVELLK